MLHRVLITGVSGYLGGDLLARLRGANLPPYEKLFALVRNDSQAQSVQKFQAEPVSFDVSDSDAVRRGIVDNQITVVFFLIDALSSASQKHFITALAEVKRTTGKDVHFLHTTGAKVFSNHTGAPVDRPLLDSDPNLYEIQKSQKALFPAAQEAVNTNTIVIDLAEELGVRSYIFAPCIVYGKSEGFGNPISVQTVAIVRAARAAGRVYKVEPGHLAWPVCHISDNSALYIELLRAILAGNNPDYGKNGFYLASSGSVAWEDLYRAMAVALAKRNVVADSTVADADDAALETMAKALGFPKEIVAFALSGMCTFTAEHGKKLGWTPQHPPEHALESADEEVERILKNIDLLDLRPLR